MDRKYVDYSYDEFGDKVSMTTYRDINAAGDVTRWLRDEATGLVTNKVYADGKGPRYDYTPDGKLATRTWARGIVTTYSYDDNGSLTKTVYSDGTPTISLAYNRAGRQIEAHDAAGVTIFLYDGFGAVTNETVVGVAGTNTIERYYDSFGRSLGYALNGVRQSTLAYDPATGRLATMQVPFEQSNNPNNQAIKQFSWNYLAGTDLKSSLEYPNGLTASWVYDANNQLLQVCNATPTNAISQYDYTYDAEGRRVACGKSGSAFAQDDTLSYGYNEKSELTNAVAAIDSNYRYAYDFDDIGNREASSERGTNSLYTANNLNQYNAVDDFTPQFDDDGNQTLIKTATGVWQVSYNGENRPIHWAQGTNTISMSYDRQGRRVTKKNMRFVYNGYLQIADNNGNAYVWEPTEKIATRPLVWNSSTFQPFNFSTSYYTHDGNKNVSEVFAENGEVSAHYEYAPFGAVITQCGASAAVNPWRFSSEFAEDDTATVYYNYRHYEPVMGRWIVRDCIGEFGGLLLCGFLRNSPLCHFDVLGNRMTRSFAQYEFSPRHCELRVQLKWYLMFRNVVGHERWTRSEKSEWKRKVKSAVEGYFNDTPFRCSSSGKCCKCKEGIKVKFKLNFVGDEESLWDAIFGFKWDVKVIVYKTPEFRSWVDSASGDTFLNEDDGDNDGGGKQITAVHEVGHQLGLNHPGMWSGKSKNSSADYTADYNGLPGVCNLMGAGMALHEDDFNRAFCDHINYDECDK